MFTPPTVGTLYLVSTPIGNLEDITYRAIRILKEADLIAAEDTRRTQILLSRFKIQNRLESYHGYNKEKKTPLLIQKLKNGSSIAVVSDAGTPGISDPAFHLVRQAIDSEIPVVPVPGPVAAMAAVIISGLPTDRFAFEGFLPVKKGRTTRLKTLASETRTIIIYESPHRLVRTLQDLSNAFGDRPMAVCRELTKKFEEVRRGRISEMLDHYSTIKALGEFVLIIEGQSNKHE